MSAQYREGNKKIRPANYEELKQMTQWSTCPGSCSCDLGSRSTFDQLQYQSMVLGQPNYAFEQTRKLDLGYSYKNHENPHGPSPGNSPNIEERYSGMTDPYNPITYTMWPPLSCNCGRQH